MMEAVAAPALLKAIDWIFGESSKILQERRERARANTSAVVSPLPQAAAQDPSRTRETITARDMALHQPIEETLWKNAESHVTHLLSLLEIHTANYHLAREQHAKFTSAYAPPIIVHTLTEAENQILEVTKGLQATLGIVYGKRLTTPELERAERA